MLIAEVKSILLRFDIAGYTEKMKYPAFSSLSLYDYTRFISANSVLYEQTDIDPVCVLLHI